MNINYFKSALTHHAKGNWNKAKEIYEHILKSNPNNYSVLQNYGPLLCQLKEYRLAKNVFEKSRIWEQFPTPNRFNQPLS